MLTSTSRVGAVETCTKNGQLIGLKVGISDFSALKSLRVTQTDVIWLSQIGNPQSINGATCDTYFIAKNQGIVGWKFYYSLDGIVGFIFLTSDGDFRLYGESSNNYYLKEWTFNPQTFLVGFYGSE